MIPKIIHYCWFGGNSKSNKIEQYINKWKEVLPDYELKEWNEENFDIHNEIEYVRQAYSAQKWAFVSDYVRLKVLYEFGGIYLDTDVEVFKKFDGFLQEKSFLGFESKDYVMTAVMGMEKRHPLVKEFLDYYQDKSFINKDGELATNVTNVMVLTRLLQSKGLKLNGKRQELTDVTVYEQKLFSSNDLINVFGCYRKGIYTYHHCAASWYKDNNEGIINLFRHFLVGKARNYIGTDNLLKIKASIRRKIGE